MRRASLLLLAVAALSAFGIGDLERGNRLYRSGRYAEAVEAYRAALADGKDSPQLRYNLGTALVRLGRYDEAEQHLRNALAAVEPDLRERTLYNLGNRYLEAARRDSDPAVRAELLERAVDAYKQALRLQPGDAEAKWNLELALRDQEQPPPQQGSGQDQPQDGQDPEDAPTGAGSGSESPADPQPRPGQDRQSSAPLPSGMTREQADRILSAAEQDERELYRERLRRGQRERTVARDW